MPDISTICKELRNNIEIQKCQLFKFIDVLKNQERDITVNKENVGEQIANAMFAYIHLEDAKMRIGKVIKPMEGKSCYDK